MRATLVEECTVAETVNLLRVLVVEDHEFQRTMLEQTLRSLGVEQVICATNGAEALRLLSGSPPVDIVVTDVVMPDMDGIELIPRLRKVAGNVSLVFVSSEEWTLDVSSEIAKGHGLTVLGALGKPITPQKLQPLLDAYLAGRAGAGRQP